jgi:hypothetical protein
MNSQPVPPRPGDEDGPSPQTPRRQESYFWPLLALGITVLPQVVVPSGDRIGPPLIVPVVEAAVFVILLVIAARPGPVPAGSRPLILGLFGLLIVANAAAAGRLVSLVLGSGNINGHEISADRLLVAGILVLITNVITFALVYWQLDSGGPAGRVREPASYPDFQFPQTTNVGLAAPGWQPRFGDYLYLAYTNIVAFSPTDTMPLTTRTKALMTVQSLISLAVLVVVLARVVNILPP